MELKDITTSWLQNQEFKFTPGITIDGVYLKELKSLVDGRGDVIELWSQPWVDGKDILDPKHVYQSATDYGVIKCWHLHHQHTDQFTVTRGKLQVSLVDLRAESPTYLQVNKVILGVQHPRFLKIPFGIMHGWKALSQPEVIVVNFQTHPYDPNDEFKFPWNCVLEDVWEPKNG
jgi:dTDP-4-dehydrorhamnose 3,5-epimerase-like enzyme